MSTAQFDVTAIGNAIVDVIAQADDAFLDKHKLPKGAMNLIDTETAERLYGDMGPGKEASGGSAGNTIAGIAARGGREVRHGAARGRAADGPLAHHRHPRRPAHDADVPRRHDAARPRRRGH